MTVHVLYFGVLKESFQGERDTLELAAGSDVGHLMTLLRRGETAGIWDAVAVAVNREYAGLETVLQDGDEVAILPPVSGGLVETQVSNARPGAPRWSGGKHAG